MQFESKKIITGLVVGLLLLIIIITFTNKEEKSNNISINEDQKIEENINQTDETADNQNKTENQTDENAEKPLEEENNKVVNNTIPVPAEIKPEEKPIYEKDSKEDIEQRLNEAKEKNDYQSFADALGIMYEKGFDSDENLVKIESEMYIKGTGYFDAGEISKAYEMADIIYSKAFSSWRFRYLKIRCLEKHGRDEFEKGNYDKAEEYAMKILQIQFRPEGANLLGDIYIKKIEALIIASDKQSAQDNLNIIWDYEVDEARRARLNELKAEIEGMQ